MLAIDISVNEQPKGLIDVARSLNEVTVAKPIYVTSNEEM